MTRTSMLAVLHEMANYQESIAELDRLTGLFCIGTYYNPEIHISASHWSEVIGTMKPKTITYNPLFPGKNTEAYFTMSINGREYKIFSLLTKED